MSSHADDNFCGLIAISRAVVQLSGSGLLLTVNMVPFFLVKTCIREVGIRKPQVLKHIVIVASMLTIVREYKFLPTGSKCMHESIKCSGMSYIF